MERINILKQKLHNHESLARALALWRFKGKKIVFTNGCFDVLHLGHIDYMAKAADCGDCLIVGVNSDASVHRLKGRSRPINDETARSTLIAALSFVDAVVLFDEDTPYDLIRFIQPDVLVKGSDYKPEDIVGYDIVTAKGGSVMTVELLAGYSTSLIEKRIIDLFNNSNV
jgi:D-glycero-beta-D-manno-heptose 1-phosphate adenylyltransferase